MAWTPEERRAQLKRAEREFNEGMARLRAEAVRLFAPPCELENVAAELDAQASRLEVFVATREKAGDRKLAHASILDVANGLRGNADRLRRCLR
ncbi:MAG: hypothetical protein ABII76_17210 [Pseudomonadota bacterium]